MNYTIKILTEIEKILKEDPEDFYGNPWRRPTVTKLSRSPGAPFGGLLASYTGPIISNEARQKLEQWRRVVQAGWDKYGEPENWPDKVKDLAVKLGKAYETRVTSRGATTNSFVRP